MKKRDEKDIRKAKIILEKDPNIKDVRMPTMKGFTYSSPIMFPGIGRYLIVIALATIGILSLIVGLGSLGDEVSGYALAIAVLFIFPLFYYFYYIIRSTGKLGSGRYPVNTNFYHHDGRGIFFTRHLDGGMKARFVPWEHIRKVNYSRSWKSICILPEAEFEVTKDDCHPYKIEPVMLKIDKGPVRDLVLAIYDHGILVMSDGKMVHRSEIVKFHTM